MSALQGEGNVGAADARPLNNQEYQLLQRLLSDPFSLPIQFKTWLVAYLETSDLTLPMSAILGLRSTLGIAGAGQGTLGIFPAGLILPYGGDTAPTGALMCDGTAYSTSAQNRLFTAIGYRFGGSGGSFNVPDIRERIPVGRGSMAEHDTVGKTEGAALGQRGTKHNTTPGSFTVPVNVGGAVSQYGPLVTNDNQVDAHKPVEGLGGPGGARPNDTPAFITLNFVIVN